MSHFFISNLLCLCAVRLATNVPAAWRSGDISIVATLSSGMTLISQMFLRIQADISPNR